MQGIERIHGCAPRQAAPLVMPDLYRIVETIDHSVRGLRDRAILLVGFFGGLRRSEITGLELADLELSELGVRLTIQRSKTDQAGRGRSVVLPRRPDALCPMRALQAWIGVRTGPGGKLFYRLDQAGMSSLHPGTVAEIVKARVAAVGQQPACFSGHSLRAGLITSAMLARTDATLIARQTGHRTQQSLSAYARPAMGLALPAIA
jgi:integrase